MLVILKEVGNTIANRVLDFISFNEAVWGHDSFSLCENANHIGLPPSSASGLLPAQVSWVLSKKEVGQWVGAKII